jgi:hypothetical protein
VQAKLLAVVLRCVVVPVFTLGLFLLRRNREVLREKVEDGLSSHLLRKQAAFDDWMRDRAQEATRWSASFVVYEFRGLRQPKRRPRPEVVLASLLGHYRVYESLFIVDGEGRVLTGTREEQLEDWARPLVQGEVSFDGVVVSPLRKSQLLGRPTQLLLQVGPDLLLTGHQGRGLLSDGDELVGCGHAVVAGRSAPTSPRALAARRGGHILARAASQDAGVRTFPSRPAVGLRRGSSSPRARRLSWDRACSASRNLAGRSGRLVATVPSAPPPDAAGRRGLITPPPPS